MARNTDDDWDAIARAAPYYGVLTNDRFLNPNEDALKEFFAGGELEISHLEAALVRVFGPFSPMSALDFGCGVGRLLIPLARRAGRAYGVDIAEPMLDLARKHAEEAGVSVELGRTVPADRQFDWVNTQIVLQHIPPARGYEVIRSLWNCVAPNGVLSMHLTIYKEAGSTAELQRDLKLFSYDGERVLNYSIDQDESVGMSMYDYDLSRVYACLQLKEGTPVYMEKLNHGGCHGFRIYIRKSF